MDLNYRPTFLLGGGGDENSFKLSSNDIESQKSQYLKDDKSKVAGEMISPTRKYLSQMFERNKFIQHSNTSSLTPAV
jgi:hypothetical protein